MNNTLCILQARYGATRLPGKVLLEVSGKTLLEHEIIRLKQAKRIDKIVIATTVSEKDDAVVALAKKIGVDVFRGSELDVLDRYYQCALQYPDYPVIIRATGDCPVIDPRVVDDVVAFFESGDHDYVNNVFEPTFPDGMDIEVFTRRLLELSARDATLTSEHEHVTLYPRNHPELFKLGSFKSPYDFSNFRLTVDQPADFEVVSFVIEHSLPTDSYLNYIALLTKNLDVMMKNIKTVRNEGLIKSLQNDHKIK